MGKETVEIMRTSQWHILSDAGVQGKVNEAKGYRTLSEAGPSQATKQGKKHADHSEHRARTAPSE